MPSRPRASAPKQTAFRVALWNRGEEMWRIHNGSTFKTPESARDFAVNFHPAGHVIELDRVGWPISVRFANSAIAKRVVNDLIMSRDVRG